MIAFNYETDVKLENQSTIIKWIESCVKSFGCELGEINYIFCDDDYLLRLNIEFLKHDSYTDIISFDYSLGKKIAGDIFISVERVIENSKKFTQHIDNELNRVIIHGILHLCGLKDKTPEEQDKMRRAENTWLEKLNP